MGFEGSNPSLSF